MYLCSNGVLDVPHDATVLCIPLSYGSKTSEALYELALPQTQLLFNIKIKCELNLNLY